MYGPAFFTNQQAVRNACQLSEIERLNETSNLLVIVIEERRAMGLNLSVSRFDCLNRVLHKIALVIQTLKLGKILCQCVISATAADELRENSPDVRFCEAVAVRVLILAASSVIVFTHFALAYHLLNNAFSLSQ